LTVESADRTGLLLLAALGDLALAAVLAVVATLLLRRFMTRLAERHPQVAKHLIEPAEGRGRRLYGYLKARESRLLHDPRAHGLAFSAYVCAWIALFLLILAAATLVATLVL
jgi:hypothetical protein